MLQAVGNLGLSENRVPIPTIGKSSLYIYNIIYQYISCIISIKIAICGFRLPIFDPILLPLDRLTLGQSEEFHRAADHVAGPGDQLGIGVMAEENP